MLKYKILDRIGQGSFGTVLKAMGPNNSIVAIKEVGNCNPFLQEKVEQEVNIMKKFEHPNLVKVYDSIYNPELQVMYIVMEYCETDLLQYYKKRQMELSCE
jgi:calcium-dependent protein kinase